MDSSTIAAGLDPNAIDNSTLGGYIADAINVGNDVANTVAAVSPASNTPAPNAAPPNALTGLAATAGISQQKLIMIIAAVVLFKFIF